MASSGKLTLVSNKPQEPCFKMLPRKPIKECYCYPEVSKMYARSSSTQHKSMSPCRYCKSQFEYRLVNESHDKAKLTSPISCETFRRVKKIDYTPRSQFLRNVQSKVCKLQTGGQGDCLRTCPRSSNYHKFMENARIQNTVSDKITTLSDEHKHVQERQRAHENSHMKLVSEQNESTQDDITCGSLQKLTKPPLRKIIKSRKSILESREKLTSKSPIRDKRATQLHKQDYSCYWRNELEKITKSNRDKYVGKPNLSEYREQRDRCSKYDDEPTTNDSVDQEMEDLRKFRESNYFETHGSSHTLVSSSSGSLEQYLLNERLFPESMGRIHKQNLVVTMPPCATMQRKRIHYFPRHVVRQEKNVCNTNYRRKRCQSCPLTGHAIDLGVLKAKPPINSLALKYQKRAS